MPYVEILGSTKWFQFRRPVKGGPEPSILDD